jgi:signal transduction histidine kinase/ActR/RegA family two-component response regulator
MSIRRQDDGLRRALLRELCPALTARRARAEVRGLLGALACAGDRARARQLACARALARWRRHGLANDAAGRAALALHGARAAGSAGLDPALLALVDSIPMPMLAGDGDMRLLACNRAFAALAPEHRALAGRSLDEILGPECRDELKRRLEGGLAEGAEALQVGRVTLLATPGTEYLGTWVPLHLPAAGPAWLLRLATRPALGLESLSEQLRQQTSQKEKLAALLRVSNAVVASLDLERTLDTIAREARRVLQVDECIVFLVEGKDERILVPAACDVLEYRDEVMAIRLPLGQGVTGNVALTGRGEIVNSALDDPRAVQVPGTPVEQSSLLCVPLFVREQVAGAITLTRTGEHIFVAEDLELATLFAGQCSAAIANARLYEEIRDAYHRLREAQSQLVQSAKLNALGELAGGVAHDFNNILAAILGRTQLLLQAGPEAATRRQLEVIERAAQDGAQAVRRVQEFTRLRQDEHFDALDVAEVLRGVLELTRPAWESESKRRGTTLTTELELRARQPVAGNASELREVFTNLVLNAIDAMPWGGHLAIETVDVGGEVRIAVRDTGIGMSQETQARVFEPFFTTKPVTGTGLGLSVAYGIITRHHGRIEVRSEPGRGTEFIVLLPAATEAPGLVAEVAAGPLPRLRVLAVDDEEAVLHVLGELLQLLGQEVELACGGPAGVERFDPARHDVVFTDLGMPGVNGWDLVQAVKSRSPGTPVVIVTGWGAQIENRALQARGADIVVPKPFSLEDVRAALQRVIVRRAEAA